MTTLFSGLEAQGNLNKGYTNNTNKGMYCQTQTVNIVCIISLYCSCLQAFSSFYFVILAELPTVGLMKVLSHLQRQDVGSHF